MVVTWSTMNATQTTAAMIGSAVKGQPPNILVTGTSSKFVDPGTLHHTQYIHRVQFTGLKPGAPYSKLGSLLLTLEIIMVVLISCGLFCQNVVLLKNTIVLLYVY